MLERYLHVSWGDLSSGITCISIQFNFISSCPGVLYLYLLLRNMFENIVSPSKDELNAYK